MKKIYILILSSILLFSYTGLHAQSDKLFKFPKGFGKENYKANTVIFKLKSSPETQNKNADLNPYTAINSELLIKLSAGNIKQVFPSHHLIFNAKNTKPKGKKTQSLSLIYTLEINPKISLEDAINWLRKDKNIEYAEPIYTNHKALYIPNDPGANPSSSPPQYYLNTIQAYEAWDIQRGDPSMVIGITDNGFDLTNTDLNGNSVSPASGFSDVADADNNVSGAAHGTTVALCASGKADNNFGGAGIGFNCRFLPLKVASNLDLNSYVAGYEGIIVASQQPACKVVNMSWGRTGLPSQMELDILETVVEDYDVVLVAAAGNNNTQDFLYPASYGKVVLSVAATNSTDIKADFSTYNSQVDISAPGDDIFTAIGTFDGTSFAAPLVSGAVALVRYHYPALNAAQTIARIKATADKIDNLLANQSFKGKLGTGRLNIYRALSEDLKAITLESYNFSAGIRGGYLFRGMSSNLICNFKNQLNVTTNLAITITSNSPYISFSQNQYAAEAIASNTNFSNNSAPFQIQVANNTPANTEILFLLNYEDGTYSFTEELRVLVNPGHHDINQIQFNVNDKGNLADYDNSFYPLSGLSFEGFPLLADAGLMIASDTSKVSDAVRSDLGLKEQNFTISVPFSQNLNIAGDFLQSSAIYEDITNNVRNIGLEVHQKTYMWNQTALQKAVIVEYSIKNLKQELIDSLRVGLFADWDITVANENRANWDNDRKMGYIFDTFPGGLYTGIRLLSNQAATCYAFDNNGSNSSINLNDGFSRKEKFTVLSEGILRQQAGTSGIGNDVAHSIGGIIRNFKLGESQTVAFAFIVGVDLADLQTGSDAIKNRYVQIKTGPNPIISNTSKCRGESILIKPNNGSRFQFYTVPPNQSGASPIHTGNSLTLNNLSVSQSIYITNIDSVFESNFTKMDIEVIQHKADFKPSLNEVDLVQNNQINLMNTSLNTTQWTWKITRNGGNPNANINFVSGTNSNSQNPVITFNSVGLYTIQLISKTAEMCSDSISKQVNVTLNLTTDLEDIALQSLKIYPNPASEKVLISMPEINGKFEILIFDNLGKAQYAGNFEKQNSDSVALVIKNLKNGVYFLNLRWKGKSINRKLVVFR